MAKENELEGRKAKVRRRLSTALTDIGRLVFTVPEGKEIRELDIVRGVDQLVQSERRLRKALQRLLDARVSGTVSAEEKAQARGEAALREGFAAQREAAEALATSRKEQVE